MLLPENPNKRLSFIDENLREIYLAGGCFWGVDAYMARVPGVFYTEVGYANGTTQNPTYEEVCTEKTGFVETVYLKYDLTKITLANLLAEFFGIIDPTSLNKQGADVGTRYRTGIYYVDPLDEQVIKEVAHQISQQYDKSLTVEIRPLENYYQAEEYHQNYLEKNPNGYCHIKI